jgi:hypothetical protein
MTGGTIGYRLARIAAALAITGAYGCGAAQPAPIATAPAITQAPAVAQTPARPLPFKGRLADGDPEQLPPAVAMSLSASSPVTFSYREELTHDEYHIPLIVSAFDPVTYMGSPLGDYGVTAFASLSITEGDRILGDYTAKAHVSQPYNLYSEPTHRQLEEAARAAVRARIDRKLYRDESRLARAARANPAAGEGK